MVVDSVGNVARQSVRFARSGLLPAKFPCFADSNALIKHFGSSTIDGAMTTLKRSYGADWSVLVDAYPVATAKSTEARPSSTVHLTIGPPVGDPVRTERVVGSHPDILHPIIAKATMAKLRKTLNELSN